MAKIAVRRCSMALSTDVRIPNGGVEYSQLQREWIDKNEVVKGSQVMIMGLPDWFDNDFIMGLPDWFDNDFFEQHTGWVDSWVDEMDDAVGSVGRVAYKIHKDKGRRYGIPVTVNKKTYNYPYYSLSILQETQDLIK